jgi:hypothetical protein
MLSFDGWSIGIAYCFKITTDFIFSTFMILRAKKKDIKLLYLPAIFMISAAFSYFPFVADFFHILMAGNNIEFTYTTFLYIHSWNTVIGLMMGILAVNLTFSEERKKTGLIILNFFVVFYFLVAFFTPNFGFSLIIPSSPGENILKHYLNFISPMFYLIFTFSLFELFIAIKLFSKSLEVKGKLRLKFQMLSFGFIGILLFQYITIFIQIFGIIFSIIFLGSGFLTWVPLYYGLTPVKPIKSKKKKKKPSKSEIKLVSYLMDKPTSNQPMTDIYSSIKELNREILVFVSYSTKDLKIFKIQNIAEQLKALSGIKNVLFYEGESIDNIIKYMNDNLGQCDAFLLFCSENALSSVPVEKEWTAAEAMGIPIIPIFYALKHVPPLLQSRLGVNYDFYNLDHTVKEIYSAIIKRCIETE